MMKLIRCNGRGYGLMAKSVLLLLVTGARISAAPQIAVDQPIYDFGCITNGTQILHDFAIHNAGDAELEISRVVSSCEACLRASLEKTNIPPGGEGVLHARLDLRLLNGTVSRAILLDCNDPNNDPLVVGLTGVVVPAYQITPAEIDLDLSQGQQTAVAEIVPLLNLHAPLSKVFCDDTNITASLAMEASNQFMLTLAVAKSLPRGNATINLTIRSADTNDPPCRITGFVHNPPDLELIPERLRFQPRTEPQMRILWVKQHGASPLILLDVLSPSDKFHCEIDPGSSGYDYRIYITAWQQEAAAGQTNVLILKMRDRNQKERSVPVSVSVDQAEPKSQ
jgi:hypothetical protein